MKNNFSNAVKATDSIEGHIKTVITPAANTTESTVVSKAGPEIELRL